MTFLPRQVVAGAAMALAMALAIALAIAFLDLPAPVGGLPAQVLAQLPSSGVRHPVTAVLLNFRGYDTLLEVAVLLLAILGMLAGAGTPPPDSAMPVRPQLALQALARLLVPPMIVVSGYLLWVGAHAPGGAFQAAALLGGAAVLLRMAGSAGGWTAPRPALRLGLGAGFVLFLAVAAVGLMMGQLLRYPPGLAGALILLIEAGLTVSLGLVLAGLFLWQPHEIRGGRP